MVGPSPPALPTDLHMPWLPGRTRQLTGHLYLIRVFMSLLLLHDRDEMPFRSEGYAS